MKIKKGKSFILKTYSNSKKFFPYTSSSIWGFFEKRTSTLFKNYLSRGFVLPDAGFPNFKKQLSRIDKSFFEIENFFKIIYDDSSIKTLTTSDINLKKFQIPDFLNFEYDNYGYLKINNILAYIKSNNLGVIFYFYVSSEKKSLISSINSIDYENICISDIYSKSIKDQKEEINGPTQYIDLILNVITGSTDFSKGKDSYELKKKVKNLIYIESFPYWEDENFFNLLIKYYIDNFEKINEYLSSIIPVERKLFLKLYNPSIKASQSILRRYRAIQYAWIYIIHILRQNGYFIILDGSYSDFRVFPFLYGFLPQRGSDNQPFDIYIFGDNLSGGLGKNILIFNNEKTIEGSYCSNIDSGSQAFFSPFGIELMASSIKRLKEQYYYSTSLRYLYLLESQKGYICYGPYFFLTRNYEKFSVIDNGIDIDSRRPFILPVGVLEDQFKSLFNSLKKNILSAQSIKNSGSPESSMIFTEKNMNLKTNNIEDKNKIFYNEKNYSLSIDDIDDLLIKIME